MTMQLESPELDDAAVAAVAQQWLTGFAEELPVRVRGAEEGSAHTSVVARPAGLHRHLRSARRREDLGRVLDVGRAQQVSGEAAGSGRATGPAPRRGRCRCDPTVVPLRHPARHVRGVARLVVDGGAWGPGTCSPRSTRWRGARRRSAPDGGGAPR